MNLIVFDCDNTLWDTPYEENDELMSSNKSIIDYTFHYKKDIVSIYNEAKKDTNNLIVLLTNRYYKVHDELVYRLFQDKNIFFDYKLFRDKNRDKGERLMQLIEQLSFDTDIKKIVYYDDKKKHIDSIKKLINKYDDIEFVVNLVK
jgi:predicted phosphatase